jgi:type IV pilus assembly protein PilY1
MRVSMARVWSVISGVLLATAAATAAFADDTEIFFNQNNGNIPANIMFVLDTSGSMNDLVTTQQTYDPGNDYSADSCTNFDKNYYYYSTKNTPGCNSANRIRTDLFKCAAMLPFLGSVGYTTDAFVQWGASSTSSSSGKGTVAKPRIVTTTQTYGWKNSLSTANTTGYIECKGDIGVDGDGADLSRLYASTDTFSIQTVVKTPPGSTAVSCAPSCPTSAQQVGVWDASSVKNFFRTNSGATYTIYSANYMNYLFDSTQRSTKSKISIMHDAASSLLNSLNGVNIGLMRYNYSGSGGMVVAPVEDIGTGTNRQDRINLVNSWAAAGITPLSETLYESYLYFAGAPVRFGNGSTSTRCNTWNANGQCSSAVQFSQPSVASSRTGGTISSTNYDSPADQSCRKNFVVYLTDGLPNENSAADPDIKALPNMATLGGSCDATTFPGAKGGKCLGALAQYMYNADLRSDVAKVQNVTSYFIGFGADFVSGGAPTAAFNYLNTAATRGGGKAYTATSLTELTGAFNDILNEVIKTNTTFSAPAVAVNAFNRTQTLNDLYVSVFSPKSGYHWPGNVKKYKIVGGQVMDATGVPAVNASSGFFADSAISYWSSAVDGADVTKGGAANRLPDAASRTVYTYTGANPPAGSPVALTPLTDTSVTFTDLGIAAAAVNPDITELVEWATGLDTQDVVPPAGATDSRHEMGDPIHTQPVAMIYGKKGDGTDDTVIFVPTNDGYFHAIDASVQPGAAGADITSGPVLSGQELWSFIPREMLPHLQDLYANANASTKHYGLDGSIAILKYDVNGDGTISGNDKVIVIFGTGRNADASNYYALDVTDKLNPKFMWSIDAGTLTGLGQAWSTPIITRVNISGAGQNSQKLVAVIGGGYDASEDNAVYNTTDNVGNHIYMVDVISGALLWSAGSSGANLNLATAGRAMDHAIPSPITVLDLEGDGYADRLYAGDMAGRIWRFDITNGATAGGLVAGGVIASLGSSLESPHLAINNRRFYSAPDVSAEQKPGVTPFLNIAIGSGYRGHPLNSTANDRFYSVRDYGGFTPKTQAQFNALSIIVDATAAGTPKLLDITASVNPIIPDGGPGWQLMLNTHPDWTAGEKVLVPSRTFNDQVIFTTYTPNTTVPSDPCLGVGTGTNRVYVVNVFNGAPTLDRNKDGTLTTDERSQDLRQGGIAPETAFLFPADDGGVGGAGNAGGPGGTVTCLSGVEVLGVCTNFNQRRKTYWREGQAN